MSDYEVNRAGRDRDGDITKLCGPWGSASSTDVMQLIQLGNRFYVPLTNGSRARIEIVQGQYRPYLRTNWDGTTRNNLDDLDPC